jgi:TPR repeat protein
MPGVQIPHATGPVFMSIRIEESDCWRTAHQSIIAGEIEQAIAICRAEPCANLPECQRFLGWTYYQRNEFGEALHWFEKGAKRGDGDALFGSGSAYFMQREFAKAVQYYERAAACGYVRAFHWIAYMHHQGLGVPQNIDLAIDYYKRSAAQGFLIADRALIHLEWKRATLLQRLALVPRYVRIIFNALSIAARDTNDPRVVDVPNAFARKAR